MGVFAVAPTSAYAAEFPWANSAGANAQFSWQNGKNIGDTNAFGDPTVTTCGFLFGNNPGGINFRATGGGGVADVVSGIASVLVITQGAGPIQSVTVRQSGIWAGTIGDFSITGILGVGQIAPGAPQAFVPAVPILVDQGGGTGTWSAEFTLSSSTGSWQIASLTAESILGVLATAPPGSSIELTEMEILLNNVDCNANGTPDACDIVSGTSQDCNANTIPDDCEIPPIGAGPDCNANGIPDGCEPDCNANGIPDDCDITAGTSPDCNLNGIPDQCDLASGTSQDCKANGIPDECDVSPSTITEIIDAAGDGAGSILGITTGIAVDAAGNTYVTGALSDNAFKVTPAGVITEIINATGDGAGNGLSIPAGIATDAAGNVYVVGRGSANAFKITPAGVITEIIDTTGDGLGNSFSAPEGIAVDLTGNVYVTGKGNDNAFKITPAGVITEIIDSTGDGMGNTLDNTEGIAVDAAGNIYVTGRMSDNAFKITPAGVITEIIDAAGDGMGNILHWAEGIAVGATGNVYLAGAFSAFKITPAGVITEIIDFTGDGAGNGLSGARGIAVDGMGNTYVTGLQSDNAFKISAAGLITEIIDSNGDGAGNGLDGPANIAVDAAGNVYVSGSGSDNAFKITASTPDCNANGIPDQCDIASGFSADCDRNGIPDECDSAADCNTNGQPDICDIADGTSPDCNADGTPDECEVPPIGPGPDCNLNGVPDACDIAGGTSLDCNTNGIPDECDIANMTSPDCTGNGIPDECEPDCNGNLVADSCDILALTSPDCNGNGTPDECEIDVNSTAPGGPFFCTANCDPDCNNNGIPDACDVLAMTSPDCNGDGIPDECEIDVNSTAPGGPFFCTVNCDPDCNDNGIPDECDIANCPGDPACGDCNANAAPDGCDIAGMLSNDVIDNMTGLSGSDGVPDSCSQFNAPGGAAFQGVSDSWNIAANWRPEGVPDNEPGRVFSANIIQASDIVLLDIDSTINTMTLGPGATLNMTSLTAVGDLTIASANGILNSGNLSIGAGRSLIAEVGFLLRGGGLLRLTDPTASISSQTSLETITNMSRISGLGAIDAAFVNDAVGSVIATSGGTLQVIGPFPKANDGLFSATTGGILQVSNINVTGTGEYAANGGMIQVLPGAGGASIAGATMDIRAAGIDFGVVEVAGSASVNLTGAVTIADGGTYRGQVGASGSLNAGSAAITGGGNGGQMLLSGNMSATFGTIITVNGTISPCGPLRGCTPPILRVTDTGNVQAASMDVLAGLVDLIGGSIDITGPITIDDGGAVEADSADPLDTFSAGSIAVNGTTGGGRLEFGGAMDVHVGGSLNVVGCGGLLRGCTPPILRVSGTPVLSVGGDISIGGSTQVNVTAGPTINLAGNFDNRSIDPMIFDWAAGALTLDGVSQTFELAGEYRGVTAAGFVDNFAMGTLRVEPGTIVDFLDGFENIPGAGCEVLYVDTLSLGLGATIRLNGCFIFYRNLVIDPGGATIDPLGGGALVCFNPGDVNCDGLIELNDADAMVSAMLNPSANPQTAAASDLNGDGKTDGNDIQALVNLLLGL